MKRLFRIFELSKNEQRVVLIVMLFLTVIAFFGYERRTARVHIRASSVPEIKPSPGPEQHEDEK